MKIIFFVTCLFISANAMASKKVPLSNLGSLVEQQIINTSRGLNSVNSPNRADNEWFLKVIRLRVRPSIGVEIDWLAKASLKPEIELFFSR